MVRATGLGVDLGSLGCRFAVAVDSVASRPLWVPRQFDEALAGLLTPDPVGASLLWKQVFGQTDLPPDLHHLGAPWLAELLSRGVQAALEETGTRPQRAVFCVPTRFSARQRQALCQCAETAGLGAPDLVGDAVALAASRPAAAGTSRGTFLVYQCGHVECEVAVVSVADGHFEVQATQQRPMPSGQGLEQMAVHAILAALPADVSHRVAHTGPSLRRAAGQLARRLRDHEQAVLRVHQAGIPPVDLVFDRDPWRRTVRRVVNATLEDVDAVLAAAKHQPAHLTEVLLAGGPTALPEFADLLGSHLGRSPTRLGNWDAALGAATLAYRLAAHQPPGAEPAAPRLVPQIELVLDSAPLSTISRPFPAIPTASSSGTTGEPRSAQSILRQAEHEIARRNFAEAVRLSHLARESDVENPAVFAAMIDIHRQAARGLTAPHELTEALRLLRCANDHDPGDRSLRLELADGYARYARELLDAGRVADAVNAAKSATRYRPAHSAAEQLLAEVAARSQTPLRPSHDDPNPPRS